MKSGCKKERAICSFYSGTKKTVMLAHKPFGFGFPGLSQAHRREESWHPGLGKSM